jgi:hypothetical protein
VLFAKKEKMRAIHNTIYNTSQKQSTSQGNMSKIEIFIISRIAELKKIGWSTTAIADALGVNSDFVETALRYYNGR